MLWFKTESTNLATAVLLRTGLMSERAPKLLRWCLQTTELVASGSIYRVDPAVAPRVHKEANTGARS
jgi:hypothetical protein